jgi:hypothetical protein
MPDEQRLAWTMLIVVAAVAVVTLAAAVVIGLAVPGVSSPGTTADSGAQQQDPGSVTGEVELSALERQLASQVKQQVQSGALNLSREDISQARDQIGNDRYQQLLDEYGDVASETGAEKRQQLLQQAQQAQGVYTALVAAYWERYETYEGFVNGTDDGTASTSLEQRQAARDLERVAQNVTATADRTITRYEQLESATEENYSTVIEAIAASRANITETQDSVRKEQFVRTDLALGETTTALISPTDPLDIEGRLTTTTGKPLSDEPISLAVGNQTLNTTTDETGWFETTYRPALIPTNTTTVSVQYAPANGSVYLGSQENRSVRVTADPATVSIQTNATAVQYKSTVTVNGTVGVDSAGFAGVPFVLTLDGELLARNATRQGGAISETVRIPAAVEPGEREMTVTLLLDGQALEATNATTVVSVSEREAALSVDAEPDGDSTIMVRGALQTEADQVGGRLIELSVNGTVVGTARTDGSGGFSQQIHVPDDVAGGDTVRVEGRFGGSGTNLSPASAATVSSVTRAESGLALTPWLLVPVGLVAVLGAAYLLVVRRSGRTSEPTLEDTPVAGSAPAESQSRDASAYLDRAVEFLDDEKPAAAVQASYAALQRHLGASERTGQTHWEFYRNSRGALDEEAEQALRRATEEYERATFAATAVDTTTAREVLDAVEGLTDEGATASLDD